MATVTPDFSSGPPYPQAPTAEAWARMTPFERRRVVDSLPASLTEAECFPSEGDPHFDAKASARDVLRTYFSRSNRRVYIASELTVYYPGEPRFAPDILAVTDVETHQRMKWVVSAEGKGLDFVMEVLVAGDRRKDLEHNVKRYAALGIPEYFIFDRGNARLYGYRLPNADARVYKPILPQNRRFTSEILGLELELEGDHLRFLSSNAVLFEASELIDRLQKSVSLAEAKAEQRARDAAVITMRSAILNVLRTRNLSLTEEEQARIDECDELDLLDRWLTVAVTAPAAADIFATPRDTPA